MIHAAFSATSSAMSLKSFFPANDVPAPTTAAPGFTMSAVTMPATPAADTIDVRGARQCGHVLDAGVHDGDRGVAVRSAHRHQQRERPTDRESATDDDDVLALDGHVVLREQLHDPAGVQRQRSRSAHDEPSEVRRVQSVDVLGGIDAQQDLFFVDAVRQRELHEDRMDVGVRR